MFDVVVYLSSLNKQEPGRKVDTLLSFAEGVKSVGGRLHVETKYIHRPAKLSVILGWPSPNPTAINIKFRQEVVNKQRDQKNHVMSIDANCFKFKDTESKYLRYSLNGVYRDTGEYANKNSDNSKWLEISKEFNLEANPWKTEGKYILLLVQRDGGWGMKGLNPIEWTRNKIREIRKFTNDPILLRPHPGKVVDLRSLISPGISISDSKRVSLLADLKNAKSAFVFNSSSGVASILAGVPLWVDDASSVCWDVANKDLSKLSSPIFFDRTQWLNDLAACHWTDDESRRGLIYQKFLPYIN